MEARRAETPPATWGPVRPVFSLVPVSLRRPLFDMCVSHPLVGGDAANGSEHGAGDADGEVGVGPRVPAARVPENCAPAVPRRLRLPELRIRAGGIRD